MVKAVPGILAEIVQHKKAELRERRTGLENQAEQAIAGRRDFHAALSRGPVAIIAEMKKASPSKGVLTGAFAPASIGHAYEQGGAAALSVLTDQRYFQGSLADLEQARAAVSLPVLRKDFTIDEYHVLDAAAHGADALLLIAAVLTVSEMRRFRELAETYRMAALVEVHDEDELTAAIDSGAKIVGVNNRDLHTFTVSLNTSLRLAPRIPNHVVKVAESGIASAADVRMLHDAGYGAFLVGEHLMRSGHPEAALRALLA